MPKDNKTKEIVEGINRAMTPDTPEEKELTRTFKEMLNDLREGLPRATSSEVFGDACDW